MASPARQSEPAMLPKYARLDMSVGDHFAGNCDDEEQRKTGHEGVAIRHEIKHAAPGVPGFGDDAGERIKHFVLLSGAPLP
jgi:hypothetical protein